PPSQLYTLSLHDALPIYDKHRDEDWRHKKTARARSEPKSRHTLSSFLKSLLRLTRDGRDALSDFHGPRLIRAGVPSWTSGFRVPDRKSTRLNSSHVSISY